MKTNYHILSKKILKIWRFEKIIKNFLKNDEVSILWIYYILINY